MTVADLVLRGGAVVTFADWAPGVPPAVSDAIAIGGGTVLAVGPTVAEHIGPRTRVVELAGRTVIPGINDTHLHLVCYAMARHGLRDVSSASVPSWEGLAEVLTADAIGDDGWIRAQGWDAEALGRPGTTADVDRALAAHGIEDVPTVLLDRTGHQLLVGSAALDVLGIDRDTPDPEGGVVVRDESGEPTGVFADAATALVLRALPAVDADTLARVLIEAQRDLAALGITSVTDPGIGPGHATLFDGSASPAALTALASLARSDQLTVRTGVLLTFSGTGGETAQSVRAGLAGPLPHAFDDLDPHMLRVAGVKVFADGIQRSGTAWHREPYGDPPARGRLSVGGEDDAERTSTLRDVLAAIGASGLQAGVHATGDAASDAVVDALLDLSDTDRAATPYLIHGDFLPASGMRQLADANIGWTANPVISRMVSGIGHVLLGPERQSVRQPLGSALRSGVTVTLSSDAPVVDPDWREAVITAVQRSQVDGMPRSGDPEAVSVLDAVAMMTVTAAVLDGARASKGTLAPGRWADLVVLSGSLPNEDHVDALRDLCVDLTVVGGRVVYER
ncbi:MAG: amidohydrolase family protein [Microbacterium sp.]|uniref:amidohydrolase n=1 Tax=Microbacterium sp. TaxID=51671 RepID=UPI001AC6033D|nr:amidohydrolase family protein [Microbacterium sp.]MBN9178671.1 amidohydrolase family protein [Microbacterium sp.]